MNEKTLRLIEYMRTHWPSKVRAEWQVGDEMYPEIVRRAVADFSRGATREREFFRVAGQSGSGKTTQLLPAVKVWFSERGLRPTLVAARRFVKYHPYAVEIEKEYGKERLREMTDEVSTILMFLVMSELIGLGVDMILDVTLLDPLVEEVLMGVLTEAKYAVRMSFVAVSREISDGFILKRSGKIRRVVAKTTADEFWRASELSLKFYAENYPEMWVLIFNAWDDMPVFDGKISDVLAMRVVRKYWGIAEVPVEVDEEVLAARKVEYMKGWR